MSPLPSRIELRSITKGYSGLLAVKAVSASIDSSEVVALAGTNGSGKSTMLKIIAGVTAASSGVVLYDAQELPPGNVRRARDAGVQMVFQDYSLCDDANVIENLFLGNEVVSRLGFLKVQEMRRRALAMIARYNLPIPNCDAKAGTMSGGQRQAVAIGRALLSEPRILLLDEPSSALGVRERQVTIRTVNELHNRGVGILICSHFPEEIKRVARRVLILFEGELVSEMECSELTVSSLASLMSSVVWFSMVDFVNLSSLADILCVQTRHIDKWIVDNLSERTRAALANRQVSYGLGNVAFEPLLHDFNRLIHGPLLYEHHRFAGVTLSPETLRLLGQDLLGDELATLNRLLCVDAYSNVLKSSPMLQ